MPWEPLCKRQASRRGGRFALGAIESAPCSAVRAPQADSGCPWHPTARQALAATHAWPLLPWWAALPERGYRMRCWFRGRGFCVRPARASAPAWSSLRTRLTAAQARESPGPRLPCACQLGKRRGGRRVTPRNNGADERTRTADLLITKQRNRWGDSEGTWARIAPSCPVSGSVQVPNGPNLLRISARAAHVVVLEVGGSNPLVHPRNSAKAVSGIGNRAPRPIPLPSPPR